MDLEVKKKAVKVLSRLLVSYRERRPAAGSPLTFRK